MINQAKRQEAVQAKLTAAANRLGQSLRPSDVQQLGKIRIKLMNAGFRHEQAVAVYYGVKLIGLLIGIAGAFPPCVMHYGMINMTYVITAAAGGLGFYLPTSSSADAPSRVVWRSFLACPMRWTSWSCVSKPVWGSTRRCGA